MKYCTHCGKQIMDEAVICVGCGCPVAGAGRSESKDIASLCRTLGQRVNTNGIIWLVIGILQLIGGLFLNWLLLIPGVLNVISSVRDMRYGKELQELPVLSIRGVVEKFEPLTGPIVILIYNLLIGGVIGVVGSIYYFVGIRNFVLENRTAFETLDVFQPIKYPNQTNTAADWTCSCGRKNASYVSTCTCGKGKHEIG